MTTPTPRTPVATDADHVHLASQVGQLVLDDAAFAWYGGAYQRAAEARFTELTGAAHGVLCQSGTAALHLLMHAAGLDRDAVVAMPSFCFYSVINVVLMAGALPFLLAVNPETLVVDLDRAVDESPRGALFVAVHAAGAAVDVAELRRRRPDLVVIEDAADAQGTRLRRRQVGHLGVGAAWSFTTSHNEVHGAAVAGAVTTDSAELAGRIRRLCHYGKDHRSITPGIPLNPVPSEPGFNYMSSEIEAAALLASIAGAPRSWEERRRTGAAMEEVLRAAGVRTALSPDGCERNYYDVLFWLPASLAGRREEMLAVLVQDGCPAWTYHSLFELPWLETALSRRNGWGKRERSLAVSEQQATRGLMGIRPTGTVQRGPEVAHRVVDILVREEGRL